MINGENGHIIIWISGLAILNELQTSLITYDL